MLIYPWLFPFPCPNKSGVISGVENYERPVLAKKQVLPPRKKALLHYKRGDRTFLQNKGLLCHANYVVVEPRSIASNEDTMLLGAGNAIALFALKRTISFAQWSAYMRRYATVKS